MFLFRLFKIIRIALRFGLDDLVLSHQQLASLRVLLKGVLVTRRKVHGTRAERLRLALESLGPIFIKFGQMLSTRRDLLPADIAVELSKLQDNVPPFGSDQAVAVLERVYGQPLLQVFLHFDYEPVASASIAQVHFAVLPDGTEVAVKVLRPGIKKIIANDMALLKAGARLVEWLWADGRRLKPLQVIAEFQKHLVDELDLTREAANGSQLKRNFTGSKKLLVPEMYWDFCTEEVMVMERMYGINIGQVDQLRANGVDISRLAANGVEIFYTQVFRDGFFHADMHPGNVQVAADGRYIALDFGIMGALTDKDKSYLAQNFIAFFQRDYKRVAEVHIESGWAPSGTRVDELESAIRAVCEPIFDKPLREVSFGRVLLRLFQTSRRFGIEVQPQLVLLQKTLLNIEGLGLQLDPELDLWKTAKPWLEKWMSEQIGWRGFVQGLKTEAPYYATLMPELPRLIHQQLSRPALPSEHQQQMHQLMQQQQRFNRLMMLFCCLMLAVMMILVWLIYSINT